MHHLWPLDNKLSGNRWVKYHFADGRVLSSHDVYWRGLADWDQVVKLSMSMKDHLYDTIAGDGFRGFITYRSVYTHTWRKINDATENSEETGFYYDMQSWSIGWLDSSHAHMLEVNFHTGLIMSRDTEPIEVVEPHIHPKLKQNWARGWDPNVKARREKHAILVQGHL